MFFVSYERAVLFEQPIFTGPVACKNRIRILLLGRDADIIVKSAPVEMEDDGNEIITSQVWRAILANWPFLSH